MIKEIDVDKLHDVLEGRTGGRNAGKTFARCVQAMQYIESGIERVYFFVSYRQDIRFISNMMKDIFEYYGIPLVQTDRDILRSGAKSSIKFVVHDKNEPLRTEKQMAGATGLIIKDLRE